MNRKNLPLLLMLTAGAVICVVTYAMDYSMVAKLVSLFFVLLFFYLIGSILKWTLDSFDRQNEETEKEASEEKDGSEEENGDQKEADNGRETER